MDDAAIDPAPARASQPTPEQHARLTVLSAEMARRVMAASADAVYDAE